MNMDYSRNPRARSTPSAMAAHLPPGKREADQLLVLLLRQNGCSVPKGVSSVGDLTSDAVIEAVGSIIPGIDGSPPLPAAFSTRGLHPAERFNTSTAVASRVRDAGFPEPLSAHQLLYPAEEDTRQLLLALLSMLPPDGAPPPPPTPASATETPLSSGTRGTNQPGDLLSSDLPHKEEAVTEAVTGERQRGVVDSSPSKGPGGQDIAAEAGEERAGGGESEGGGERVAEGIAQEESSEGAAVSGRAGEGSRDAEGNPRESWGEQGQEAVGGAGDAGGERGEEDEEDQRVNTPVQDNPVSVGQPQRGGTGEGPAGASAAIKEEGQTLFSSSANEANGEQASFANDGGNVPSDGVSLGGGGPREEGGSVERRSRGEIAGDGESGGRGTVPDSTDQKREGETERVFGGDSQPGVVLGAGGAAAPASAVVSADIESGGGSGTAPEGDGVDGPVDRDPALVGVERFEAEAKEGEGEGDGGVHEDCPASNSLETHEGEPDLEDVASETTTRGGAGSPATDEKKGRCSAVAAEDEGGETDGGLLIKTSLTGEDSDGRRRDSEDDGLRGSPDASAAGLEVTPPPGEGGAPDDGRGEGAAPVLERGEGSDAGRGGAASAAKVLDDGGVEEDVVFLQFEVDAQEVELERLLKEEKIASEAADELEEEVRRLGTLTEEREKHCRYATKALELLPNVADETAKLQKQCAAAESRMQAARKAFDKTRRPLEDVVRVQREELARRKARCRALLTDMRSIYAQCEEMTRQDSLLRAAARDMEACERRDRGEIVVGDAPGEDSDGEEWGREDEVDEEAARRRKAGALLRTDIDLRISGLCEDAMVQKQEIAISLSEVLDARREANSAWELLGRSEALSEERLFTAAKEARLGGGASKDRAKDLIDAYKCLHELDDLFLKLVEAVSEVGKREEEYRVVEKETDRLLRWQGGTTRLELLSRDLRRVKEDAFALEQRLDQALDNEKQHQKNSQEAWELEEEEQAQAQAKQAQLEGNAGREDRFSGEGGGMDEEDGEEEVANRRWDDASARARHEDVEEAHDQVSEEEVRRDEEGEARLSERDARGGSLEEDDVRATGHEEVDFVGEDDEENVWQ